MSDPSDPSDPQSDADKIRLKRLARLQTSRPASTSRGPSTSATPAPAQTPQKRTAEVPAAPATRTPAPRPSTSTPPAPAPVPAPPKAKAPELSRTSEPYVQWESKAIGSILRVTLDRAHAERTGWTVAYLKPLLLELQSETSAGPDAPPPRLTPDILDRLLIVRLSLDPNEMSDDGEMLTVIASLPEGETVFEYLVGAWRRARVEAVNLAKKGYSSDELKRGQEMLDKLRDLLLSYAGLTLQDPTMFPQPEGKPLGASELLPILIPPSLPSDPLSSAPAPSVPRAFAGVNLGELLADLGRRFDGDGLEDVLGPVVQLVLQQAKAVDLAGNHWRSIITAVETLVHVKPIAAMFTQLDNWMPENPTAQSIETDSLLGPLVRLSTFSATFFNIASTYFENASINREEQNQATINSLRSTLEALQGSLFNIFNAIVRSSPAARERVLEFFGAAARLNVRRGAMRVDPRRVASDGFMLNLQVVLGRFADPFMDAAYSKLDKIDVEYFKHSRRLDISDATKIKAAKEETDAYFGDGPDPAASPPNFISEIFFLASTFHHLGWHSAQRSSRALAKQVDHFDKQLAEQRDVLLSDPRFAPGQPGRAFAEGQLRKHEADLQKMKAAVASSWVQLEDPNFMSRTLGFYTFVATWLVHIVDPTKQHPKKTVTLPLPADIPTPWRMLPEYILEDTVDFFNTLARYQPHQLESSGREELLVFCITFITSPQYIGNPYSRNKLIEILWNGTHPYGYNRLGVLGETINFHTLSLEHLMSALMSFYIDVERTGVSSQFYDRLNVRYNIARLLKVVWNNPTHRDKLRVEAKDIDKFVKFTNLIMNDSTYLLDEALSKLAQVRSLEDEMASPGWDARPEQERHEREDLLEDAGRVAGSYVALGGESVRLLVAFTAETKDPFMMPEIVDRLAAMLTYNLDALAGPRCQDLKVSNPEKYGWRPRQLLGDILQVFLNLVDREEFVGGVARDGRSYSRSLMERAAGIARRHAIKTEAEISELARLVDKVEEARAVIMEEDDTDVPEEFMDTLMATLMRDPVILPSSGTVLDRSTIKSHLLSDATDPYNRSPLTIDQVIPHTELKAKIDAWLEERKQAKLASMAAATNAAAAANAPPREEMEAMQR